MAIHPTAVVDPRASIDPTVDIGPYVVVDGPVEIGPRTKVAAHAVLCGPTRIGADNQIHMGAVLGNTPQDRGFDGSDSYLVVGDRNLVREYVTIHRGTQPGSTTRIGDDNLFMATSHIAHNCTVGNGVTLANGAVVGGHATLEDRVFLSGNCAVHQHVRVGTFAFLRGLSAADKDVPPFCIIDEINVVRALNRVGLLRAGFDRRRVDALRRAFRILFQRRRNLKLALAEVEAEPVTDDVQRLIDFIRASRRGVCVGPAHPASEAAE